MIAPISGTDPLVPVSPSPAAADPGDVQRFSQAMNAAQAPAASEPPTGSHDVTMDDFWKALPEAIVRTNMQRMSDATQKIKESFEG